ncbi:MAG: ATP-dependent DNA ligase, partial [Paeniglutamicibacter sp.]
LALPAPGGGGSKSRSRGPAVEDLGSLPYRERRSRLLGQVDEGRLVQIPEARDGSLSEAMEHSAGLGLEGVVAKDKDSGYEPGRRTGSWIKLKHANHQEVVVIGWRRGNGSRARTFGSLLLGVNDGGQLHYAGRVGTGFSDAELRRTRTELDRHARKTPAAKDVPDADSRDAAWVSPVLVGEVRYTERTRENRLRHPVWRGWRRDKAATDVRWEGQAVDASAPRDGA